MPKLDDFLAAHDEATSVASGHQDLRKLYSLSRRARWRPWVAVGGTVAFLACALILGFLGEDIGYLLAVAIVLTALPDRIRDIKKSRRELSTLVSVGDLQAHLLKDAQRNRASAFVACLGSAFFAALFAIVSLVALILGKHWQPGLVAAIAMAGLAAYELLVSLPRAHREASSLKENTQDDAELSDASPQDHGSPCDER